MVIFDDKLVDGKDEMGEKKKKKKKSKIHQNDKNCIVS